MALELDDKTAREMVQAKLLGRLFASQVAGELVLKGGMALRVSTDSTRLTKDIDLMSPPGLNRVENRIKGAINDLKASGLVAGMVVSQPKRTDTTWRWKIGGRVGGTIVNLTVEVSRRAPLPDGHVQSVSWTPRAQYGMDPIMVDCLDGEMLAASKVSCLIDRQREAPRDLFDIHLLVTTHVRPPIEALRRFGREALQEGLDRLWAKIEQMDYKMAATELLPHLEPEARAAMTPEKWDEVRMIAGTAVEAWLKEALDGDGGRGGGSPRP